MDPIEDAILRVIRTITAYDEGLEAGKLARLQPQKGAPDYPYAKDSAEFAHWIRGFEDARDHAVPAE